MSQTEKQTMTVYILFNISKIKDKQTMKFGPLIEYNVRNIFFSKIMKNIGQGNLFLFFNKASN